MSLTKYQRVCMTAKSILADGHQRKGQAFANALAMQAPEVLPLPDHLDPFYDDGKLEQCKAHVKALLEQPSQDQQSPG